MNHNDLKNAFRALANQDAQLVSPYSRARVESRRPSDGARHRRAWFTASGLTLAAAAAVVFAVMPRQDLLELNLSGTRVTAATDFLLNTPGSSLMRSVPSIGFIATSRRPAGSPSRRDTSRRDQ